MSAGRFLLELLCEEIPANALPAARRQLEERFAAALDEAGCGGGTVTAVSTVRRLVVFADGLPARQPDRTEEVLGPPVKAAFAADGSPTKAAEGFARAQGVAVDALRVVEGPKGQVVAATRTAEGLPMAELLAALAADIVPSLHFPKTMRWGAGDVAFVRPVHNLVALFGEGALDTVVPLTLFGIAAGSTTPGHRVTAPQPVELAGVEDLAGYLARMEAAGVIADPAERRTRLEAAAQREAEALGCEVRPDPELVAEHVELVEYPGIVRGAIAEGYLELPEVVLVTTLRHHQKCLVLTEGGRVAPHFLAVADRPDDPEGLIRQGSEWVAGARLADAAFFFAQDRRTPLAERFDELERVVFHAKLGSYAEKAGLVSAAAAALADAAGLALDRAAVDRAARLAKIDLVTAMVGEFPELQGTIGGIYAAADGEPAEVADAVADQYVPAGLDGRLPRGPLAAVLGAADRLDTLGGLFAVGEIPSGSKDPFALRRAALAVLRIAAEHPLTADVRAAAAGCLERRRAAHGGADGDAAGELDAFLRERLRYYLVTVTGVSGDVAEAVLEAGWGVVPDAVARAEALDAVRSEAVFADLAVAFKRVRNMVSKSGSGTAAPDALEEDAERELLARLDTVSVEAEAALAEHDHRRALRALANLAAPLDRFFTDVLVLCEDERLRDARLALLARVEALFLRLADLSRLAGAAG